MSLEYKFEHYINVAFFLLIVFYSLKTNLHRSRYISAITSMALIAELPHHVIFRVLSEKIHITNLMPFLKDVNTKNTNEILEWVLAEEDWRLWQVQSSFFVLWVGSVYLVILSVGWEQFHT